MYKGKLERVSFTNETAEQAAERICEILKIKKASYNDTWLEELKDTGNDEYFIRKDIIYKTNAVKHEDSDSIFDMDDDLRFTVRFYNGGCCLSEALDTAWDNKKNGGKENGK